MELQIEEIEFWIHPVETAVALKKWKNMLNLPKEINQILKSYLFSTCTAILHVFIETTASNSSKHSI